MSRSRLEAFSDGVIAIVITIMVLELAHPGGAALSDLAPLLPKFLTYAFSFIVLGIYWSNHHHLFQVVERVNGAVLWANLHLLFWLSLIPFVTAWAGENGLVALPVSLYGVVLLLSAAAYNILARTLLATHSPRSHLAKAMAGDVKGRASLVLYTAAIPLCFLHPIAGWAVYVTVALIWLVPDRRIEKVLSE